MRRICQMFRIRQIFENDNSKTSNNYAHLLERKQVRKLSVDKHFHINNSNQPIFSSSRPW